MCGTPASGTAIGAAAKAVGTYTNYDHIIIPGGITIMTQNHLKYILNNEKNLYIGQCPTPRPAAGLGVISIDRYCGNVFA